MTIQELPPAGESLSIPERVVVAPAVGIFHRMDGDSRMNNGDVINQGDVIGRVHSLGASTLVHSPFAGLLVQIMAFEGERVHRGQPLAWVRSEEHSSDLDGPASKRK